jgi:hypothetical protein
MSVNLGLIVREKRILRLFGNMALRRTFGLRERIRGGL